MTKKEKEKYKDKMLGIFAIIFSALCTLLFLRSLM